MERMCLIKMKATIVLIANNEAENLGRRLMLSAHRAGNLGFEMARLPQHVSLKQPFSIPNLEVFEEFFDMFAKEVRPVTIKFTNISVFPSNVLGYDSGCIFLNAETSRDLQYLQEMLFTQLDEHIGKCPADHDEDYVFHMTVALGGAPYNNYEIARSELQKADYKKNLIFDKLGLLYYDDDDIKPGTYFCYKVVTLA
ncbi:MAG: hypothetical protein K0S61_3429 [Anaerocolumna sp.]|jgi:2'-5' RNA ligase|nr:hypothetical protein [Anaerocolumna sp.]